MNLRHQLRKLTGRRHNVRLKPYFLEERHLGSGKSGDVHEERLLVTWKGKTREKPVAVKRSRTKYYNDYGGLERTITPEQIRKKLARTKRVWRQLKGAGLPVPEQYTPIFRKKSPHYLSLVMTQLEREHGKLIKGHETQHGSPVLFHTLDMRKDKELIGGLAKDVATIHNLGYDFPFPDIWAYYKKGNTYGRVVMDLDDIRRESPSMSAEVRFDLFKLIGGEFAPEEYHYFQQEYRKARKV